MPLFDPLRRLRRLSRSSPKFPNRLTSFLHERGYRNCVGSLQNDDLAWLIGYLDDVRPRVPLANSPPKLA